MAEVVVEEGKLAKAFVSRWDYLRRHAGVTLPYLTARKIENLLLNQIEMRIARIHPRSVPPYIKIEATPLCHLSCGGCVHGDSAHKKTLTNKMHLSIEKLSKAIDSIVPELVGVSFSYSGEPLLNRSIVDLVKYVHERNICSSFSTNLSVPMSDSSAEALVSSGLDRMQISLDGASEATYMKYRVGGNFALVIQNVRKLANAKKRLRMKRPILVWKMVVFPHNRHEIDLVKRSAVSLGFDTYEFVLDYDGLECRNKRDAANREMIRKKKPCFWVWNTATINWSGSLQACCKQINSIELGNIINDDIRDIWQGQEYARLRQGFTRTKYGSELNAICRKCIGLETTAG